jgi:hypothetical protein
VLREAVRIKSERRFSASEKDTEDDYVKWLNKIKPQQRRKLENELSTKCLPTSLKAGRSKCWSCCAAYFRSYTVMVADAHIRPTACYSSGLKLTAILAHRLVL